MSDRIASVTDPQAPADPAWVEPASRIRLRWGRYRARWIVGLALIMIGTGLILLTSAYSLSFFLIGMPIHAAGWIIQPTSVARRVAVVLPALGVSALLLAGPSFAGFFAVPLGCWLLVRFRPGMSWLVLALPIVSGILLTNVFVYYSQAWISAVVSTVVVVASAWIARAIAQRAARRRPGPRPTGDVV